MRKMLLIAAVCLAVCSCGQKLVIIHTNDTHSHLEPGRSEKDFGRGGLIERAAYIDSVRLSDGEENVLLLHAGDFNQGSPYFTVLGGKVEVEAVNALRYDCITLGNHEFDNGLEDLTQRVAKIKCPVVCANLDLSPFELGQYVKPYVIIEKAGKKIGIIGLAPQIKGVVKTEIADRIPQLDNVETVNKYADCLHNDEKCDMIILLSHMGYKEDQEIVPDIRYVDLIIGGHSHTFVDDIIYVKDSRNRRVGIVTDGCFGVNMGEITVNF